MKRPLHLHAQWRTIPCEETCNGHGQIISAWSNSLEEGIGTGFHGAVEHDLSMVISDTGVHGAAMQIAERG
jgi:hypothetical protein